MAELNQKKLVLASASPRRKKLLKELGFQFEVIPSTIEEYVPPGTLPDDAVKTLALQKAQDISNTLKYPAIIIGADTTVVINNESLGKPRDTQEAFEMLKLLSGNTHTVITGIAIIDNSNNKSIVDSVYSEVTFKKLSDEEIVNYIKTKEPMDKAGAYAIQGIGSIFIEKIQGCYSNIVGLPVPRLNEILKQFDIDVLQININGKNT